MSPGAEPGTPPRRTPLALVIALALAALAAGRCLVEARSELRAGDSYLAAGDIDRGVRHLRRAAHWYLPGSPYVRAAYDSLERFAEASEVRGQHAQAAAAWRAVRASALATRWLYVPHRDRLDRANRRLARWMASQPPTPDERHLSLEVRRERHLALLIEDRSPEPGWVLVTGGGFALWVLAAAWAARHAWGDDDRPLRGRLLRAGLAVGVGMGLFLLGLARA